MKSRDRKALLELVLMIGALCALGFWQRPEDPFLLEIHPHPFWAIILLSSLRYANPVGLLAGLLCAAAHALGLSLQGYQFAEAFHLGNLSLLVPFLYPVAGSFVGETIQKYQARASYLQRELKGLGDRYGQLEQQRNQLEAGYRQLEGRVAGENATLLALHDALRRLDALDGRDIYRELLVILHDLLGVEDVGLWLRAGHEGWEAFWEEDAGEALPRLAEIALREGRVVAAHEFFAQETVSPRDGVVAGLLQSGEGECVGVIVIRSLRFRDLT
ncbi:MAG: hypothetical protein ACYTGH_22125, partial [Planctomycetota bacterium]